MEPSRRPEISPDLGGRSLPSVKWRLISVIRGPFRTQIMIDDRRRRPPPPFA